MRLNPPLGSFCASRFPEWYEEYNADDANAGRELPKAKCEAANPELPRSSCATGRIRFRVKTIVTVLSFKMASAGFELSLVQFRVFPSSGFAAAVQSGNEARLLPMASRAPAMR
jgi:hypothetical protein